jgi:hypothetical protein
MTPDRVLRKLETIVRRRSHGRQGQNDEIQSLEQLSPKWAVPPPVGAVGLCRGAHEVSPSDRIVLLFTIEVTLDQTLGNRYHFIKPICRIKNLLRLK